MDECVSHKKKLKEILSKDRYQHSKSVAIIAEKLALKYGVSSKKAIIASLLHDCSKGLEDSSYFDYLKEIKGYENLKKSDFVRDKYSSLHARVSEEMAKKYFEIDDEEILVAISNHTYGCKDIDMLSKILYIADVVEPLRGESEELNKIRKILEYEGVNRAIIYEVKCKIKSLIKRDKRIPVDLVEMYNSIMKEMEGKK